VARKRSRTGGTNLWRVTLLLTLLGALGFFAYQVHFGGEDLVGLFSDSVDERSPSTDGANVAEMGREQWSDALRLRPDGRFLGAVADIDHLARRADTTGGGAVAERHPEHQMWVVRHRQAELGQLDPLPSAESMTKMLDEYARSVASKDEAKRLSSARASALRDKIDAFQPPHLFEALAEIDAASGEEPLGGESALQTARALTYLLIQTPESLELTDPLASRALAALALAHQDDTLPANRVREVDALLMATLGYTGRADDLADKLDADHPAAAYIRRDAERLQAQADEDELARFLLLRLAQERFEVELWESTVRRFYGSQLPSAATVATAAPFVSFRAMPQVESSVRTSLVEELSGGADTVDAKRLPLESRDDARKENALELLRGKLGELFEADGKDFDRATEEAVERAGGHVFDADLIRSYAQSAYLSSAYREIRFYVDSLSAPMIAQRRLALLRTDASAAEAKLAHFLGLSIDRAQDEFDSNAMRQFIEDPSPLAGQAVLKTYEFLASGSEWGSPANFALARTVAGQLDSRLEHRAEFASELYAWAWEIPATDRMVLSLMDSAPVRYRSHIGWYARRNGDLTALEKLMEQAPATSEELLPLLRSYLELDEASAQVAKGQFQRLLRAEPARWSIRKDYSDFLFDEGAYPAAEETVFDWLENHGPGMGLEEVFAHIRISRARRLGGDADSAWKAIAPVISSQQAGAIVEGARVLEATGELERAEELLEQALERYPNTTWVRAALVKFLWKRGRLQPAADTLSKAPSQHDYDWSEYGDAFFEAFEDRDVSVMARALDALQAAGLPPLKLRMVSGKFARHERWSHAFELSKRLKFRSTMLVAENFMSSYTYLKAAEGKQRARQWLESSGALKRKYILSMMAFQEEHFDYLWEVVTDPPDTDVGHSVWLFRAAAYHKSGVADAERTRQLEDFYAEPSQNWYHRLGRYVWTGDGKEALLADATSAKKRCEVAYWMGLKAQLDGDYAAASDWYHVTALSGATNNGEYHWALDELHLWAHGRDNYSLARLQREEP
jgi:hypothetical protein